MDSSNDVEAMSIKEMKALITKAGLSHADCFEKSDLRQRAREALAKTASAETQLSESDEIEDSDDDAPPAKRAKADDAKKPHVYALMISTGRGHVYHRPLQDLGGRDQEGEARPSVGRERQGRGVLEPGGERRLYSGGPGRRVR